MKSNMPSDWLSQRNLLRSLDGQGPILQKSCASGYGPGAPNADGWKGVRKREKGNPSKIEGRDCLCAISDLIPDTIRKGFDDGLAITPHRCAISLTCAFLLNCYRVSCTLLGIARGFSVSAMLNSLMTSHSQGFLAYWGTSSKTKLCKKSNSVILSLIIILFFPVIAESFCPRGCQCDDTKLSANCENISLQIVPILLNPRVQTIILARNKIQKLSQALVFFTDLLKLDISHNEINDLEKNNFKSQKQLTELRLSYNKLTLLESKALHGLIGLKILYFDNNQISTIEDNAFLGLNSLVQLDLSNNKLKILSENSLSTLPSLSALNLSGNKIANVPSVGLNNLTSLLELNLSDNHISQVPDQAFIGVAKLSHLILDKNNISSIDPWSFSGLYELQNLSLTDNRLLQVPSIALSSLPDLQHLDLSGNLFGSLPQDCFAGLDSLSSLKVSRCPRLSSVGSEAFLSTSQLETLILSHNPLLSSLSPTAFASLLSLRHVDLTACGLLYLTPTQVPVAQLETLHVSGNPLHCNCSLLWLARLISKANASSISIDQPTCASPPTLYGVSLRELSEGGVGCNGGIGWWTILICVGVAVLGLAIIAIFLICRWRKKKKKGLKKRNGQDKTLGMWSDVWRPENHLTSATHLPPPPPPNGDIGHYQLPSPPHLRSPPRMPLNHPLHHLHHHHHQGCLQQCPYATLHPVYHPLLHPDHNSSNNTMESQPSTLYGHYTQTHNNAHSPNLNSRSTPRSLNDTGNWYETIHTGEEGLENGLDSRPMTPLDLYNNSPRKVPVTYV